MAYAIIALAVSTVALSLSAMEGAGLAHDMNDVRQRLAKIEKETRD